MKSHRLLLASVLVVCLAGVAAAQKPAGGPPANRGKSTQSANHPAGGEGRHKGEPRSFKGAAKKLGTTPQALADAYKGALQANPKLTRGQFIAANMLAHNLGGKYPSVTVSAILDGLKSGKSIGQTLQALGVGADEAKKAEADADQGSR
jgi:hypothetical protein